MAALAARLPALLKGEDHPKDAAERLALAQMCYDTKRHAAAARFWAEALAADPKLGDDRQAGHRYNAACAAALAGAGQGKDDPPPDDAAAGQAARPGPRLAQGRAGRLGEGAGSGGPRPARWSSRRSSTGRPTPTWPASAMRTPWRSSPRPSASPGGRSGPRSTPCWPGPAGACRLRLYRR